MRRAAVLALGAAMAAVVVPAHAQAPEDGPRVRAEAWFWRSQAPSASPVGAPAPDPAGHLMVAVASGRWEKLALVRLDLGSGEVGSLELALDAPADEPTSDVDGEAAEIRACLVGGPWDQAQGGPWDLLPPIDCTLAVPGEFEDAEAGRRLVFDLTAFAEGWAEGLANHGVAIVPAVGEPPGSDDPPVAPPDSAVSWQVGLHGLALDGIHLTSTPPARAPATPAPSAGSPGRLGTGGTLSPGLDDLPPAAPPAPPAATDGPRRPAAIVSAPRALPALVAFDRSQQAAAAWAAALIVAASVALAARQGRSLAARLQWVGASLWFGAALAVAMALDGVRQQAALQWQLPYAASGGLAAVVLSGAGAALFAASLIDRLPDGHPLRRQAGSARRPRGR